MKKYLSKDQGGDCKVMDGLKGRNGDLNSYRSIVTTSENL